MDNIEKVLGILKGQGLDGIYITKEANVKYISGYPDELAYVRVSRLSTGTIMIGVFLKRLKVSA